MDNGSQSTWRYNGMLQIHLDLSFWEYQLARSLELTSLTGMCDLWLSIPHEAKINSHGHQSFQSSHLLHSLSLISLVHWRHRDLFQRVYHPLRWCDTCHPHSKKTPDCNETPGETRTWLIAGSNNNHSRKRTNRFGFQCDIHLSPVESYMFAWIKRSQPCDQVGPLDIKRRRNCALLSWKHHLHKVWCHFCILPHHITLHDIQLAICLN